MIKTEHDNVLTLYCQDKKIVTNGKLLRVEMGFPYQIMSFRYVGKSSTEYTKGKFYNVIDCSPHWYTNEIVVSVTDNEYPETTDVDFCTPFSFDVFLSDFEYDSKYLELMNKIEKMEEQLSTAKKHIDNLEDHLLPYSKEMIQKIRDEKMQLVTVDEFVKLQKESLTAIRENDKLKEQLDTAKKALTEIAEIIDYDIHECDYGCDNSCELNGSLDMYSVENVQSAIESALAEIGEDNETN